MSIAYIKEHKYLFIFILISLCILIYKIQHTFLYHSKLPVFKNYEIWKWLENSKLMTTCFDETSKYYDAKHITTVSVTDTENIRQNIQDYCLELQKNFLSENQKLYYSYHPTFHYIYSLHANNAFMSTYTKNQNIISRIFSRKLTLCMYRTTLQNYEEYDVQFNDFICTKPYFRKKEYTQRIIYTHMANICNQSKNLNHKNKIFIAKYENKSMPLIPIVSYMSCAYDITHLNGKLRKCDLTPVNITKINSNNIQLYHNFMVYLKRAKLFRVILHESNDRIEYLIEKNIIIVYVLHHKNNVYGMYVFHDTHMKYKGLDMIECINSVRHSECDNKLFYDTFVYILQELREKKYSILILEYISHNPYLHKYINNHVHPLYTYPVTFNIVNYQQIPYYPNECLFIL